MPAFDLFGLGKSPKDPLEEPENTEEKPAVKKPTRIKDPKRFYGILLAADALVIVLCLGLLGARVFGHLGSGGAAPAGPPEPPKKAAAKKPAPKPAAKKPAPKPAAKKPAPKPAAKKPAPKPAAKKPAPKPAAKKPSKSAAEKVVKAKPVPFTYINPSAAKVHLAGYFLVRTNGFKQMFRNSEGTWETTIYLKPGATYRYRYQITDSKGGKTTTGWESVEVK